MTPSDDAARAKAREIVAAFHARGNIGLTQLEEDIAAAITEAATTKLLPTTTISSTISKPDIIRAGLDYSGEDAHYRSRPTLISPDGEELEGPNLCYESFVAGARWHAAEIAKRWPSEDLAWAQISAVTRETQHGEMVAFGEGFWACYRWLRERMEAK